MPHFMVGPSNIVVVDYCSRTICLSGKAFSLSLVCVLEFPSSAKGFNGLMVLYHYPILELCCLYGVWSLCCF
jgi:hypothetical protein